jgi:plastocyanin
MKFIALVTLAVFLQSALAATINIAWTARSYTAITAAVGDQLIFRGTASHNLYKMPTLASFRSCTFTGATKLGYVTTFTYTVTAADKLRGTIRFACSPHCVSSNQKIAVRIV